MSGGVDSSVAACLLKQQGYEVIGVTMQIWQEEDNPDGRGKRRLLRSKRGGGCTESRADCLDIPYYVMNFRKEFDRRMSSTILWRNIWTGGRRIRVSPATAM